MLSKKTSGEMLFAKRRLAVKRPSAPGHSIQQCPQARHDVCQRRPVLRPLRPALPAARREGTATEPWDHAPTPGIMHQPHRSLQCLCSLPLAAMQGPLLPPPHHPPHELAVRLQAGGIKVLRARQGRGVRHLGPLATPGHGCHLHAGRRAQILSRVAVAVRGLPRVPSSSVGFSSHAPALQPALKGDGRSSGAPGAGDQGSLQVMSSHMTRPNAYTSLSGVALPPLSSSGAILQGGVPAGDEGRRGIMGRTSCRHIEPEPAVVGCVLPAAGGSACAPCGVVDASGGLGFSQNS